jgi:hypothetical protein
MITATLILLANRIKLIICAVGHDIRFAFCLVPSPSTPVVPLPTFA